MKLCGIYSIRNTVNGKTYFGSTKNWRARKRIHLNRLKTGTHINKHLQSAFKKYGESAFQFRWEMSVEEPFLAFIEQVYLDNNLDGYNVARDAFAPGRGRKCSEDHKRKISAALQGHAISQETREAISQTLTGRKVPYKPRRSPSTEHRRKLAESLRGNTHTKGRKYTAEELAKRKPCKGAPHTEETKRRLSKAMQGNTNGRGCKGKPFTEAHKQALRDAKRRKRERRDAE